MTKKERYERFIAYFSEAMPEANTELHYTNPFDLLVAVMLSAQCTDKRVNMVTPALMAAYPTAAQMAKATKEDVLAYVKSVSILPYFLFVHPLQTPNLRIREASKK